MANDNARNFPSLLEALKGTGMSDLERKVVEGVLASAPVISRLPQRVINGINYTYLTNTSIPLMSARPMNAGTEMTKDDNELKNAQCFFYDGKFGVDIAIAEADPGNFGDFMETSARRRIRGFLCNLERTLFYGKAISGYGMPGLPETIGDYMTISADSSKNDDAHREYSGASVWLLSLNQDYIRQIWGNKKVLSFSKQEEVELPRKTAEGHDGTMTALMRKARAWTGFSQRHAGAVSHIVNESGSKPLTDALLQQAVDLFPSGMEPNLIVMGRQTRSRLINTRAASFKYVKGSSGSTPFPGAATDFNGIPIVVSDMLIPDETPQKIAEYAAKLKLEAIQNTGVLTR